MGFQDNYPLPELRVDLNLKKKFYPHVGNGAQYILDTKKVIVGDQMGLGKTVEAIAAVTAANAFPCLVICPSSLKMNWEREFLMWTNMQPMILSESIKNTFPLFFKANVAQIFIVNFESLKKYFVAEIPKGKDVTLKDIKFNENINIFKSVIIDEGHRVKEPKAMQSKLTRGIADGKEYRLLLTGTPVVNSPTDLAAPLAIIGQIDKFGGYKYFMERYNTTDPVILEELRDKLYSTCYFRREKSDVLDLPAKTRQIVYCDITNREEYNVAENSLIQYLREYKQATNQEIARSMRGEAMVRIGVLKNISARGKIEAVTEYTNDVLANGEKAILFGHLQEVLDGLKENLPCVSVTGKDNSATRQRAIDSFQNDPATNLIICSIGAGGVGITLTASQIVMFIEMGWHPAIHDQAEDRAHRIGQKGSVNCIYFIGRNTIDEWVYSIIDQKRAMSNSVMGSSNDVEESVLNDIIELYINKI